MKTMQPTSVTRVEVIGKDGREYVRYLDKDEHCVYQLQDDGRTLKLFIEENNDEG